MVLRDIDYRRYEREDNWGEHTLCLDEKHNEENEMLTHQVLDVIRIMCLLNINAHNCNVFWLCGQSMKQ